MIGELNCGHTYVGGGEMPHVETHQHRPARRGTQARREMTKYYKIVKILKGRQLGQRSGWLPLTETGVNVKEGDYIGRGQRQPTMRWPHLWALSTPGNRDDVVASLTLTPVSVSGERRPLSPVWRP